MQPFEGGGVKRGGQEGGQEGRVRREVKRERHGGEKCGKRIGGKNWREEWAPVSRGEGWGGAKHAGVMCVTFGSSVGTG